MIDISIKMPPAPTPPRHSDVDPVTSIPRSHRIDESAPDQEKHDPPPKKKKKYHPPEPSNQQEESSDQPPHIDNYA